MNDWYQPGRNLSKKKEIEKENTGMQLNRLTQDDKRRTPHACAGDHLEWRRPVE